MILRLPNNPESRWYVRDRIAGQPRQVWVFDEKTATRIGVANPQGGAGTHFKADPGEDIWDCIRRQTPWLNPDVTEGHFHLMTLGPAEFYPRIARPNALATEPMLWSPSVTSEKAFIASARNQLTLLVRRLEIICQTVQPSPQTLDVYGHEIRNLLILAATEAEMHWRGILSANRPSIQKFNSNEYVKLIGPLKLRDYQVMFYDFPDLEPVLPFAGWTKEDPTKSLAWFDAYHGVKHNREAEFSRGTLGRTFEAVSACVAMLVAQFGPTALNAELSNFVELRAPAWPIGEMYLPRVTDVDWTPVQHPDI
jgi:hypothetical protein